MFWAVVCVCVCVRIGGLSVQKPSGEFLYIIISYYCYANKQSGVAVGQVTWEVCATLVKLSEKGGFEGGWKPKFPSPTSDVASGWWLRGFEKQGLDKFMGDQPHEHNKRTQGKPYWFRPIRLIQHPSSMTDNQFLWKSSSKA